MRRPALLAALAALVLSACDVPVGTSPKPTEALSGALMPTSVQTALTVSATDTQGQQSSKTYDATLALVNGRLPANPFAAQKSDFAATVNASGLNASQKASLVAGANEALDKLESDLNAAFDGVPRRMSLTLGNRVGDLANASFLFKTKAGTAFTMDGLYNLKTTEFLLASIGFARGDGNSQAAIVGLSGCAFQGALNRPTATHGCSASGLLAVANAGVVGVGVNLTLTLGFVRD